MLDLFFLIQSRTGGVTANSNLTSQLKKTQLKLYKFVGNIYFYEVFFSKNVLEGVL